MSDGTANFPKEDLPREKKLQPEYGLQVGKAIWAAAQRQNYGFNFESNYNRYKLNRKYSEGLPTTEIMKDRQIDTDKESLSNLDYATSNLLSKIARTVTARIADDPYKAIANAVDPMSMTEEDLKKKELEFKMILEKTQLNQEMQNATGKMLTEPDEYIPTDKGNLELYMTTTYKRARCASVNQLIRAGLEENKFYKKKYSISKDLVDCKVAGTYIWLDNENDIRFRKIDPAFFIVSRCVEDDFSDAKFMGEVRYITAAQLRKEAGDSMTEEEICEIAEMSQGRYGNTSWEFGSRAYYESTESGDKPYDNFNIKVMDFEFLTNDVMRYEKRKVRGKSNRFKKVPFDYEPKRRYLDVSKIIEMSPGVIYKGSYVVDTNHVYGWGLKENMIRPKKKSGKKGDPLFSWVVNMPQQFDMRNKSMIEEAIYHADQITLCELNLQQLLMHARPPGLIIDMSSLPNAIKGIGGASGLEGLTELRSFMEQTGDFYYSSKREDGLPITNTRPVEPLDIGIGKDLERVMGLIEFHHKMMREAMGVPYIADAAEPSSDALVGTSRMALANHQKSLQHLVDAFKDIMQRTSEQIFLYSSMLIQNGVNVEKFERIVGKEDVDTIKMSDLPNRDFGIHVYVEYDEFEREDLMLEIKDMSAKGVLQPEDSFAIKQFLKDGDVYQAELYLVQKRKEGEEKLRAAKEQEVRLNAEVQRDSAIAASEAQALLERQKIQLESEAKTHEYVLKEKYAQKEHERAMELENLKGQWEVKKVKEAQKDEEGRDPSGSDFI